MFARRFLERMFHIWIVLFAATTIVFNLRPEGLQQISTLPFFTSYYTGINATMILILLIILGYMACTNQAATEDYSIVTLAYLFWSVYMIQFATDPPMWVTRVIIFGLAVLGVSSAFPNWPYMIISKIIPKFGKSDKLPENRPTDDKWYK